MTNLRHILASNLKESRKKQGFSQAKLAEKADTSTQHIAMIEISRKFPSPEMLEHIASALDIEAYELFAFKPSLDDTLERLRKTLVDDIRHMIIETIREECPVAKRTIRQSSENMENMVDNHR